MSTEDPPLHTPTAPSPSLSPPEGPAGAGQPTPGTRRFLSWRLLVGLAVLILIVVIWRELTVSKKSAPAVEKIPAVAVARVTRADLYNEVTIPGEFRPYVEVDIHAKVAGYVSEMKVDFGDRVKAGQLLATLEVPELADELHNAIAQQQRAEADYTNAHLIYDRLSTVNKEHPNLVALQELDTAAAKDSTAAAAIAAAKADVAKFQTLVDYTKITAPFDGVITKRYADPGALMPGGTASSTQSLPLVRVSDNYRLRLDVPVSLLYVKDIHVGDTVDVSVDSLGGKTLTGVISRSTDKVNEDTRTMIVEVEVANPELEIVPGMYATVKLKVQRHPQTLAVPTEVIGGEKNPTVYVVNTNSEIEARNVTIGLETPDKYEVTSGLKEGELVIFGNKTFVRPGEKVEPKLIAGRPTP